MRMLMTGLYVLDAVATLAAAVGIWRAISYLKDVAHALDEVADKLRWLPDIGQTNREVAGHLTRALMADVVAQAADDAARELRRGGQT